METKMSLEITVTPEAIDGKRISIKGSLDSNTAPELQRQIDAEITDTTRTTIMDFKELNFLSSAGLRVIFKTKKVMDKNGGKFLLVNLQPQIKKVFEIIKALDGMNVFKDQDEMDDYLTDMQNKVIDEG
ncbi:MAG: anti-sigma F factor antagonist [Gammaproteobacteria bacterium]|nr:MAG: anti-sigma F factor antagonist [Gammaproteobacteria bacterium]